MNNVRHYCKGEAMRVVYRFWVQSKLKKKVQCFMFQC